jgi:hypothetical protein
VSNEYDGGRSTHLEMGSLGIPTWSINGGHEQLISNGGRFKPAFTERDKKPTLIDLRGISPKLVLKLVMSLQKVF